MEWQYLFIVIFALCGLFISAYIFQKKKKKKKHMVCPIGGHCEAVIDSKYGKTLGIENSLMGALYYFLIAVVYLVLLLNGTSTFLSHPSVILLVEIATTGAFAFSAYLIGIQAFVLKKWCTWCVSSALLTTGIFVLSVFFS